jgi:streptogramin lyase
MLRAALLIGALLAFAGCLGFEPIEPPRERPVAADPCAPDGTRVAAGATSIPIGGYANLVAAASPYVWTIAAGTGSRAWLVRFEPRSGELRRFPFAGSGEARIEAGFGAVWVADPQAGRVDRYDLGGHRLASVRPFGRRPPLELAVGEMHMWAISERSGQVAQIDALSGRVVRRIRVHGSRKLGDVAAGAGSVWVSEPEHGRVTRLASDTGRVLGSTRAGSSPIDVEVGDGRVWVDRGEADRLAVLEARNGRLLDGAVPNGGEVFAIAAGFGSVWATNYGRAAVTRIDAGTRTRVGRPIPTGHDPKGIAIGDDAVWVANAGECTLTRIAP